jgi:hypothetical protein
MKELEQWMFRELQEAFASAMKTALEMLDQIILEQRDRQRFRVKAERETSVNTVFGSIRFKLIERAEEPVKVVEKRKARVLFVEADGLYTKLRRRRRRGMEHAMAAMHEGWVKVGKRVQLKDKQYYLHRGNGDFWEGFGDFPAERYEIDEDTWLVVNGDGAPWIGECESYFHKCIYTLDRYHVARDLKRFVGHLPKVWKDVRQSLARQDAAALLAVVEIVPAEDIEPEQRKDWEEYKQFLKRHRKHLEDYRKTLQAAGIDTSGMRPMGSGEAQMRIFARRTKRGGYSWSERGVSTMLRTIMRRQEAGLVRMAYEGDSPTPQRPVSIRKLLRDAIRPTKGYISGMIRLLRGPWQSSTTGMALKGLRGY